MYQWKYKQAYQRNRIENPEIDPHKYSHWFLTKMQKQFNWESMFFVAAKGFANWTLIQRKKVRLNTDLTA